jgi:hypothetical protein
VNALLVIDKSGSMTDPLPGTQTSRWDALKQALNTALRNVQDDVSFGMVLYPPAGVPLECNGPQQCCAKADSVNVQIGTGAGSVDAILNVLDVTSPGGGTPTASALELAREYFTTGPGASLEGEKFVVLATDGGPNCNFEISSCTAMTCTTNMDQQSNCTPDGNNCCTGENTVSCLDNVETVKALEGLKAANIPTFVIGLPGTEQYASYLDSFAVAGGQTNPDPAGPKYFAVDAQQGVAGLTKVFTDITNQLVRSCDVTLTQEPPDPEKVNVAVNCEIVPQEGPNGVGWTLQGSQVVLEGAACNFIQTQGADRVDVIFGCPTIVVR